MRIIKRMPVYVLLLVLLAAMIMPVRTVLADDAWWNTNWLYRRKLTIDNSTIAENLTDFPVGIFLSGSNFTFSEAQSAGQDIRFLDSDGATALKYEIVSWSSSSAEIYVKVPQIDASSSMDYIWMYWGNSSATDGQNVHATWNSGYAAVYHMNDASTTTIADSTSNANTGIKREVGGPVEVADAFGKAQSFDGSNDRINCGNDSSLNIEEAFTLEVRVKPPLFSGYAFYAGKREDLDQFYILQLGDSHELECRFRNGSGTIWDVSPKPVITPDEWNDVVFLKDGDEIRAYLNGVYQGTAAVSGNAVNTESYYIGQQGDGSYPYTFPFHGLISEVRFSSVARSAGWIAATNKSLRDTYVSFGTKQGKPLPPANLISTRNGNNIDLTWDMGTLATGVIIVRGTSDYPASPTDGVVVYTGAGNSYTDIGAASDTEDVYYSAFSTSEWGTSAAYSSTILGGGMSKIVLLMTLMGAAIILTISGYISRKSILAVMGGLFWVITGVYAYTLSAQNWSAWDIYLGLAFGCLFCTIVSVIAPIMVRERNEEDNELPYKESDVMQFNREMSEMNMQLHAMNSYPPQTQTPSEEPNVADIQRYIEQTRNRTIKKYKGMQ